VTRQTRRFGVELEVSDHRSAAHGGSAFSTSVVTDSVNRALNAFIHAPVRDAGSYCHSDGTTWDVKRDASCGYEVATPALTLDELEQVVAVARGLYDDGFRATATCGLHVHVEVRDFNARALRRLVRFWAAKEKVIFAMLKTARASNHYCRSIKPKYVVPAATTPTGAPVGTKLRLHPDCDSPARLRSRALYPNSDNARYDGLNLKHFWAHGRVEFRVHHGTLDARAIREWVNLLLTIVENAAAAGTAEQKVWSPAPTGRAAFRRFWNAVGAGRAVETATVEWQATVRYWQGRITARNRGFWMMTEVA